MARLTVKSGVQPRLVRILCGVANVAARLAIPEEVVVTSAMDSTHGADSLHYALRAIDLRTKNFPSLEAKQAFAAALRTELGSGYQVIFESQGLPNEHIHLEWDPA